MRKIYFQLHLVQIIQMFHLIYKVIILIKHSFTLFLVTKRQLCFGNRKRIILKIIGMTQFIVLLMIQLPIILIIRNKKNGYN